MFDSHFHVTDPRLNTLPEVTEGRIEGVEIGTEFETFSNIFEFASQHENVYCTAGIYPAFAEDYSTNDFENFVAEHIDFAKFVAIGECGIDYHRPDMPSREKQLALFEHQIFIADRYHKPLVVHSREAWEDTAEVLIANKNKLKNGVLIHCMSYTADQAQYLMKNLTGVDVYFAFGGHITYKNKEYLHDTMRVIPLDRILLETDAPYLAPTPKRGELNRPSFLKYTAQKMAEILGKSVTEIETITRDNAYRFYKIKAAH